MWKKLCNTIVLNWTWNASKFSNVLLKRYALFVYVQITQNVCSWNGLSLYLPYILAALCAYVLHLPRTRHIDPGGSLVITKMNKGKTYFMHPHFVQLCMYSIAMDRQFIPIELVSNIGPAGSIAIIPVNKGFFSLDAQVSFLLYS